MFRSDKLSKQELKSIIDDIIDMGLTNKQVDINYIKLIRRFAVCQKNDVKSMVEELGDLTMLTEVIIRDHFKFILEATEKEKFYFEVNDKQNEFITVKSNNNKIQKCITAAEKELLLENAGLDGAQIKSGDLLNIAIIKENYQKNFAGLVKADIKNSKECLQDYFSGMVKCLSQFNDEEILAQLAQNDHELGDLEISSEYSEDSGDGQIYTTIKMGY